MVTKLRRLEQSDFDNVLHSPWGNLKVFQKLDLFFPRDLQMA